MGCNDRMSENCKEQLRKVRKMRGNLVCEFKFGWKVSKREMETKWQVEDGVLGF